jgi:hypothetical protein
MDYEDLLTNRPNSKIYNPEPVPGAVYEPMIAKPRAGRPWQNGTMVIDGSTGDRLLLPWGPYDEVAFGNRPEFNLSNDKTGEVLAGNYRSRSFRDRGLKVFEITRVHVWDSKHELSRSELDGERIARLFRAHTDVVAAHFHRRPAKVIVLDSRPATSNDESPSGNQSNSS